MQRFAVMFRIKPGTEDKVRQLLSSYDPPNRIVDEETRLVSTSVFLKDGLVVRMIEIEGQLPRLMAHMSRDASIQAVERELDKYLVDEERRDTSSPEGAKAFFLRALMETVVTRVAPESEARPVTA